MTATLHIVKGATPGEVPLSQDRTVLGRNPDCHVVIPVTSVSREHAHILRVNGQFYIEDLRSRNGTIVNNEQVSDRRLLKNNDKIRICDFQATFQDARIPLPEEWRKHVEEEADPPDEGGSTTVEATMLHNSSLLLDSHPSEKLRNLVEISGNLSKTLELDRLLPKIVDSLFQLFKQADRCFIILVEEGTGKLLPKVIKTRRPQDEANARFSRSVVKQCLESKQGFLSNNADTDKRILSQSVVDFRIRSVMCAPLIATDGNPFGVIQLDTQDRSKKFGNDDLSLLMGVANQASIALENAKLYRDIQVRTQRDRDLHLAEEVQRGFLPLQLPEVPGYEFYAHYSPAQEVGGDYYGFVPLGPNRLAFSVGDVAGKGVPAALLMAKLSSDVRYCLLSEAELTRAIAKLNDLVYLSAGKMDRFITLAGAVLDFADHVVTIVNAGHVMPLLYRGATGTLEDAMPKGAGGLPMGILDGQTYDAYPLPLAPGDCLLVFSDGVHDAVSVRGESFGLKGIPAALKGESRLSARALGERIVKAVKLHAAGRAQADDITLVCVGRTG
ncbi:MAG TPA: SpoIIE family protein phosphatase [Gemmataceae bacterium]|nr:SpoIIE family protein phosphatase [Gemmataceae bacterium]